jgi:hypothetical protein
MTTLDLLSRPCHSGNSETRVPSDNDNESDSDINSDSDSDSDGDGGSSNSNNQQQQNSSNVFLPNPRNYLGCLLYADFIVPQTPFLFKNSTQSVATLSGCVVLK